MSRALYWWRVTARRSWRQALVLALLGGLLGSVALGAVAGARRTSTAYDRYLTSIRTSDAFVNVPGRLPAEPVLRPIRLISQRRGIVSSATYIGLVARAVINGRADPSFNSPGLIGSLDGEYFRQDRMTVLAGRLPSQSSTTQIAVTPGVARAFGARVGGRVTYELQQYGARGLIGKPVFKSYQVAAIVELPPVLAQVRQSIRPQVIALAIFGGIAALAMLVLVGQGLTQLISRSAPDVAVLRMLGATRAQTGTAAALPGLVAIAGGGVLAVAGAVALSPLAPVGSVRSSAAVTPWSRGPEPARRPSGPRS